MENQPELERQRAELEQEIDAKTIELENKYAQLETEMLNYWIELSPEEIEEQLKALPRKWTIASMEAQHLERLLNEQKQLQQTYDAILLRLQNQEELAQPFLPKQLFWRKKAVWRFRRRVQRRVADKLLSQTNADTGKNQWPLLFTADAQRAGSWPWKLKILIRLMSGVCPRPYPAAKVL